MSARQCPICGKSWLYGNCNTTVSRRARCRRANPYTQACEFRCPCHEPEWCADNPAIGCDLCRAYHGHLTLPKYREAMP